MQFPAMGYLKLGKDGWGWGRKDGWQCMMGTKKLGGNGGSTGCENWSQLGKCGFELLISGLVAENKSCGAWDVVDWAAVIAGFWVDAYPLKSNCKVVPGCESVDSMIEDLSLEMVPLLSESIFLLHFNLLDVVLLINCTFILKHKITGQVEIISRCLPSNLMQSFRMNIFNAIFYGRINNTTVNMHKFWNIELEIMMLQCQWWLDQTEIVPPLQHPHLSCDIVAHGTIIKKHWTAPGLTNQTIQFI